MAEAIQDPWYRCQALSYVADHLKDQKQRSRILDQSFRAALETKEPNRVATVSSWPLGVVCRIGDETRLVLEINRLISIIEREPHPTRRGDGLFFLLKAVAAGPNPCVTALANAFLAACASGHGWKRDRNLRDAAGFLHRMKYRELADRCLELIDEGRIRRQAVRLMAQ